jgi:hydroxymethylglutaryl-CoA lyase
MSFPENVRIREVGPRDGFQNEPEVIPTAEKVRLIGMLGDAGLRRIELTSFVRADVIPQLADAEEVLAAYDKRDGVAYSILIPNERGLERALAQRDRFDEVNLFLSASETHNRRNVNRSIAESLAGLGAVIAAASGQGLRCEGVISTSFGCPYEGDVAPERIATIVDRVVADGADRVAFGDTTGMATPRRVSDVMEAVRDRQPGVPLLMHFHNTRGTALANVLTALRYGITEYDASVGGLGGCPYAPGATGNVATEEVVHMLHDMGIDTGIDLDSLLDAARLAQRIVGRELPSGVLRAGPRTALTQWTP